MFNKKIYFKSLALLLGQTSYVYIYIYCLSVGRGVSSWGCQLDVTLPFLQGVAVVRLPMVGLAGTVSPVGEHKV